MTDDVTFTAGITLAFSHGLVVIYQELGILDVRSYAAGMVIVGLALTFIAGWGDE